MVEVITSCVSGRGNVLCPMCMCMYVIMCTLATELLLKETQNLVNILIIIITILDKFESQGQRSRVKVRKMENYIFFIFSLI